MGEFPHYRDKGRDMKAVWDTEAVKEQEVNRRGKERCEVGTESWKRKS